MFTATVKGMLAHKLRAGPHLAVHRARGGVPRRHADAHRQHAARVRRHLRQGQLRHRRRGPHGRPTPTDGGRPARSPTALLPTVRPVDGVAAAEGQVERLRPAHRRGRQADPAEAGADRRGEPQPRRGPARATVAAALRPGARADRRGRHRRQLGREGRHRRSARSIRILFQGPAEQFTVVGIVQFAGKDDLGGATDGVLRPRHGAAGAGQDRRSTTTIAVEAARASADEALARRVSARAARRHRGGDRAGPGRGGRRPRCENGLHSSSTGRCWSSPGSRSSSASFIIWNTFSMQVTQRTRELALLRAIGATRRQVHAHRPRSRPLLLGLAASALGVGAGSGRRPRTAADALPLSA